MMFYAKLQNLGILNIQHINKMQLLIQVFDTITLITKC